MKYIAIFLLGAILASGITANIYDSKMKEQAKTLVFQIHRMQEIVQERDKMLERFIDFN